MAAISSTTAALIIAGSTLASAGLTAGVAYATRPDDPELPKFPRIKKQAGEVDKAGKQSQDRARQQAAAAFGRSDTLLTGPRGLLGEPAGGAKTILGR